MLNFLNVICDKQLYAFPTDARDLFQSLPHGELLIKLFISSGLTLNGMESLIFRKKRICISTYSEQWFLSKLDKAMSGYMESKKWQKPLRMLMTTSFFLTSTQL